ncbi:MAG: RidA family protein [Gemmatimonadetes bacterium]|nr:RidA family protein [Gemmatimonadota bacterium]
MRTAILSTLLLLALSSSASAQQTRQYINGRSASQTGGLPFSGAVLVGNTLYLSGVLGAGATPEEAARAALDSIKATLEAAGMTMDDLVSVQIFAADLADYAAFNTTYRTYFTREFPARAFLGSGPLLNNARFEVLGIAVKR